MNQSRSLFVLLVMVLVVILGLVLLFGFLLQSF